MPAWSAGGVVRRRILSALLLAAVFFLSLALNMRGIAWARLAPDEHRIAAWMGSLDAGEKIFIRNRVYPEGLFTLAKAIRFLERKGEKMADGIASWQEQRTEGLAAPPQERPKRFHVVRIRRINAWLGAFATAFVFLAFLEVFGGPVFAALGALLFAFHPLVVEHAHYAETDMMMLFMGALSLWALTRAGRRASAALFLFAAFLVGGAIASKFTLATTPLSRRRTSTSSARGSFPRAAWAPT